MQIGLARAAFEGGPGRRERGGGRAGLIEVSRAFRSCSLLFLSCGLALRASIMHLQACGGPEGLILGAAAIASGGV